MSDGACCHYCRKYVCECERLEKIQKLEAVLERMDEADPDDVDSGEYQRLLKELVDLKKFRGPWQRAIVPAPPTEGA